MKLAHELTINGAAIGRPVEVAKGDINLRIATERLDPENLHKPAPPYRRER